MKEVSPFTDQLYDHTFDIDQILTALCGCEPVYLNTQTGKIQTDEILGKYGFLLEPLPHSFVDELKTHPKLNQLAESEHSALQSFLSNGKLADFPAFFEVSFAGGWVRERVKDVALEWLDLNGLIPPSMRHVRDSSAFTPLPESTKIKITEIS